MPPKNPPQPKFADRIFSTIDIEEWFPGSEVTGQGFRCHRPEFVTFFKQGRIKREFESLLCRCWIVHDGTDLVGYITLLADRLTTPQQRLLHEQIQYTTYPAVKIGLLAVDKRTQGVGTLLVEWSIEYVVTQIHPRVGVRFLTVDALYDPDDGYDTSSFYQKMGFQFADMHEAIPPATGYRTMFLDLKPLLDRITSA